MVARQFTCFNILMWHESGRLDRQTACAVMNGSLSTFKQSPTGWPVVPAAGGITPNA